MFELSQSRILNRRENAEDDLRARIAAFDEKLNTFFKEVESFRKKEVKDVIFIISWWYDCYQAHSGVPAYVFVSYLVLILMVMYVLSLHKYEPPETSWQRQLYSVVHIMVLLLHFALLYWCYFLRPKCWTDSIYIYIYITEVDAYHFPPTIFGVIFEDFFATKLGTQTFLPNIKMTGYRIHGTFWILHRDRLFPCHIYADSWLSWKEMIGMLCEYDSGFQRPKIEHYWN